MKSKDKVFPWLIKNFGAFYAGGEFQEQLTNTEAMCIRRYEVLKPRTCRNYAIGEATVRKLYELLEDTFISLDHPITVGVRKSFVFSIYC